jgi:flagellar biosynthetic protein FlhB
MAEENADGQEKTEDATEQRREDFREKGDVATSKEFSSVAVLAGVTLVFSLYVPAILRSLKQMVVGCFSLSSTFHFEKQDILPFLSEIWVAYLKIIAPLFIVASVTAIVITFMQTRLNLSFGRLSPNFGRLNPMAGIGRMFSKQVPIELLKSVGKMLVVFLLTYVVLMAEKRSIPGLMGWSLPHVWSYWGSITQRLFYVVAGVLLFIALADFASNYFQMENKLKMTKQEVKEETKQRETDPQLKGRQRKMQRDIATRKTVQATRTATVIITNPTHFAVALKYEPGMSAPILVAKGMDFVALTMREVANEHGIPIVENPPLARKIYRELKVNQMISEELYRAVSEVIRYVYELRRNNGLRN